uniref:Uncharacterized protein n=1 Tax=Chenopodium quinoa TaxID=63459 RepID=A0A803NAR0_CHEQI
MYQPNNQGPYTHHTYVPGQSLPPSIHNPSLSYPPQFQSLYSNPSVSLPMGFGPGKYPSSTPCFGLGQYPSNTLGFGAQPVYSDPAQFQSNWVVRQSAPVTYSVGVFHIFVLTVVDDDDDDANN